MKSINWLVIFLLAAVCGIGLGYVGTLLFKPSIIPPSLRLGGLTKPVTVLFLGVDIVYNREGRRQVANITDFTGRSDTIMVARLDPMRNTLGIISVPRDTEAYIPGHGHQKINAANALGGPQLAMLSVGNLLDVPIDHYVVLNVHGLIDLVNELGGVTVNIPKRMQYMDWTAKLKIDLEPGPHTLTGNQSMGFVRFRHDALGDIGRVQRQEIFIRAVLDKALSPQSWGKLPQLMSIAKQYLASDLNDGQMIQMANFIRTVPKKKQQMVMLPGRFAGNGNWEVDKIALRDVEARIWGEETLPRNRQEIKIVIENMSSDPDAGQSISKFLQDKGYTVYMVKPVSSKTPRLAWTKIIAQQANPDDALLVKTDLSDKGEVVIASIGDIESSVTLQLGDDLSPVIGALKAVPTLTTRQ